MAEGNSGLSFGDVILFGFFAYVASAYWNESNGHLKSIDKKMHTHAADGSINGISGWY